MSTSSANPGELRDYLSATSWRAEELAAKVGPLGEAVAALRNALPAGYELSIGFDLALPVTGRVEELDAYVETVAAAFEAAGAGDTGGVVTVDDSTLSLPPVPTYDQATIDQLAARIGDELTQLRENVDAGNADETSIEELTGLLAAARSLVEGAPADERQGTAEDLLFHMGPGDVQVMLDMLEEQAGEFAALDGVVATTGDLGVLLSYGLEGQAGRSQRWIDTLTADHDWYHDGPPEMLVLLGAMSAQGTSTFGTQVWSTLWDHTYMSQDGQSIPVLAHKALPDGILDQVYGTANSLEIMAGAASDNPPLANGIVMDVISRGPGDFEHLFAQGGTTNPSLGGDGLYESLGTMLTASVDVSLPLDDRLLAASQTMTMYDHVTGDDGVHYYYAEPILQGLGTMTQPLLANLNPTGEYIVLPGADATVPGANQPADALWSVVQDLANTDAGSKGLAFAVEGATGELLVEARENAGSDGTDAPLDEVTLNQIGRVMGFVVEEVAGERQEALVEAVEGGGLDAALQEGVLGGLGATPFEPIAVLAETVLAFEGQDVVQGGSVLGPHPEARLTSGLVLANLSARPQLASPELIAGLHDAAENSGANGVYTFLEDASFTDADYPGLGALRSLVNDQQEAIGASAPALLDQVYSLGG